MNDIYVGFSARSFQTHFLNVLWKITWAYNLPVHMMFLWISYPYHRKKHKKSCIYLVVSTYILCMLHHNWLSTNKHQSPSHHKTAINDWELLLLDLLKQSFRGYCEKHDKDGFVITQPIASEILWHCIKTMGCLEWIQSLAFCSANDIAESHATVLYHII